MDLSQIFEAIKSTYGPPIAIAAGAFYWFWRDRPSKRLDDADNDSSVRAIDFWEKAASRAEALNEELRKRADDFARERNELAVALARMESKVAELQATIEAQRKQIEALTSKVQQLRGASQ